MKNILPAILLNLVFTIGYTQQVKWQKHSFEMVNTKYELVDIIGSNVLKLERDLISLPFDEKNIESTVDQPTFAKLIGTDIKNGIIQVKVMSKIMENSPFKDARGFIGIGFRIDSNNHFECI